MVDFCDVKGCKLLGILTCLLISPLYKGEVLYPLRAVGGRIARVKFCVSMPHQKNSRRVKLFLFGFGIRHSSHPHQSSHSHHYLVSPATQGQSAPQDAYKRYPYSTYNDHNPWEADSPQ